MNAVPTFDLPECPKCSNRIVSVRPLWRFASNTSRKRGRNCYIFGGCPHALAIGGLKIVEDPEELKLFEDLWARSVEQSNLSPATPAQQPDPK